MVISISGFCLWKFEINTHFEEWTGRGLYPSLAFASGVDLYETQNGPLITMYGFGMALFYSLAGFVSHPTTAITVAYITNLLGLIVPFYFNNQIVGYTARKVTDGAPKYMSEQQPGYVFNMDQQDYRRQFVIVVEGPMDAIGIEGLALLGSEVKDQQHLLIKSLNKQVILVPDRDEAGHKLIDQAIEFGWSVSMPDWDQDINDVNDAITKYGRIYTLHQIVTHSESSSLKIKLRSKKWFG